MSRGYRHNLNGSTLERGATQLVVEQVGLAFGGVLALDDVSLTVRQGEIHAIIGPNGAGKTSLLNCISGLYRPQRGLDPASTTAPSDRELTRLRPRRIARCGVARSFQNIELFRHMTVLDNLMLGRHVHMRRNVLARARSTGGRRSARRSSTASSSRRSIDFLEIEAVRKHAGRPPRLRPAEARRARPRALPAAQHAAARRADGRHERRGEGGHGPLHPRRRRVAGVTVVLIEHDMGVVMDISDRVAVLDFGKVIADGTPAAGASDPEVIRPTSARRTRARAQSADASPSSSAALAERHGDRRIALREKRFGIWQPITWAAYNRRVRRFALGLAALGFERGDTVAILGDNRPEWLIAELAAQSLGGVSVGLYPDGVLDERSQQSRSRHGRRALVVAEDQEQVDKLITLREPGGSPPSSASSSTTRAGSRSTTQPSCSSSPTSSELGEELERDATRLVRRRWSPRASADGHGDPLHHVGHHRQAEARDADPPQPARDGRRACWPSTRSSRTTSSSASCRWPGSASR